MAESNAERKKKARKALQPLETAYLKAVRSGDPEKMAEAKDQLDLAKHVVDGMPD